MSLTTKEMRSEMIKNKFKFKFYAAIAAISLMLFDGTALAETYRVTVDAAGGGTGLSWESPMTIEEGLFCESNHPGGEVWIKEGTYVLAKCLYVTNTTANLTIRGGNRRPTSAKGTASPPSTAATP